MGVKEGFALPRMTLLARSLIRSKIAAITALLFTQACVVLPDDTDEVLHQWKSHVNQARKFLKNNDYAKAEREYASASKFLGGDSELDVYLALTLRELGFLYQKESKNAESDAVFQKAADIFQRVRKQDADIYSIYSKQSFDVLYQLGLSELRKGNAAAAMKLFHQALWADSINEESEHCKEQLLMLEGAAGIRPKVPEAIFKKVRELAEFTPHGKVKITPLIVYSRDLFRSGDHASAIQFLQAVRDLGKQRNDFTCQAQIAYELLMQYCKDANFVEAEKLGDSALALAAENEEYEHMHFAYLIEMMCVYDRTGRQKKSDELYAQLLKITSNERAMHKVARVLSIMAQVDMEARDFAAAERAIKKSLDCMAPLTTQNETPQYKLIYATILLGLNRLDEAKSFYESGLKECKKIPEKCRGYECLADLYLIEHNMKAVKKNALLALAIADDPYGRGKAHWLLAKCAIQDKDYIKAEKEIKLAQDEHVGIRSTQSIEVLKAFWKSCDDLKSEIEGQ